MKWWWFPSIAVEVVHSIIHSSMSLHDDGNKIIVLVLCEELFSGQMKVI